MIKTKYLKKTMVILSVIGLMFLFDLILGTLFYPLGIYVRHFFNSAMLSMIVMFYVPIVVSVALLAVSYFALKINSLICLLIGISLFICARWASINAIAENAIEYISVLAISLSITLIVSRFLNYGKDNLKNLKIVFVITGLIFVPIFIYSIYS